MAEPLDWFVFFGTHTALVRAVDEEAAFVVFCGQISPDQGRFGRYMLPARDEVTIRRPRESDRGWIKADPDAHRFLAALPRRRKVRA